MYLMSSKIVRFRWILPIIITVLVVVFLVIIFMTDPNTRGNYVSAIPLIVIGLNYLYMKISPKNFVDAVWLEGNSFVVKDRDGTHRIPLSAVEKAALTLNTWPQKGTLYFKSNGRPNADIHFALSLINLTDKTIRNLTQCLRKAKVNITTVRK